MTEIKQEGNLYIIDEVNNTLTVDGANTRVGIGNNSPGHALSVTGDGNFTANLSAGSNLFLVDAGNSRITLGTTTAVAGNVLTVVGNTDIAGTTNTTTLQLNGTTVTATATELNQLSGITLGTAASADTSDFATAAQGTLADTALQVVAVDGVTITGDGTGGNPLVAAGGGISIGDAVGSGTAGSLLFVDASTNLGQDNANLYWDDTNNRLGIGTNTPSRTLEVNGGNANQIGVFTSTDATARVNFMDSSTTSDTHVGIGAVGNDIRLWANNQIVFSGAGSGNVGFNSGKLANYNGTAPLDGQLLIGSAAGTWEAATLTAGTNITITNAGGSITIDAAGGGGGTPGGNPGDVQVNDGAGGFGAASVLQDIDYVQLGQSENDVFTAILSAPSWGPPGPPATIQEAIDRLASFVAGNLGPIP